MSNLAPAAPESPMRRTALRIMATTAAAWWAAGSARAATGAMAAGLTELRIGYQKSTINLVLARQQALLEKRLPGTKVSWYEFPAGPQLLEALSVGSIDLGATGDAPPVFAQAAGKDIFYVGAEPAKPDSSAILVKPGSPLRQLADLKGRRIALQKGSSAHFLLLRAVARAGLSMSDITPIYLTPSEARAAFERDSVDAWVIWDPFYAATEIDKPVRVLATSRGLTSNNTFYLASRPLAGNPAALAAIFSALTEADNFVQTQRSQAAALYADAVGLGLATVHRVISRRQPSPVAPVGAVLVAEQQQVADAFAAQGLIPRPIRVADIVWQPGATLAVR